MLNFKFLSLLAISLVNTVFAVSSANKNLPIFATYISDNDQERKAEALIKSIRLYAGTAKDAEILVFIDRRYTHANNKLNVPGVEYFQIEAKSEFLNLPYSNKVYAAAQAETMVEGKTNQLYWFDPETLVLDELKDLNLSKDKMIALRPVFLTNKVAINSENQQDFFWTEIFKQAKVDFTQIFDVNTVLDGTSIKAYFNCGVMSVDPSLKLFRQWAHIHTEMLQDSDFLRKAIVDTPHKIFFHQAVFTAVVLANIQKDQIQWLSLKCAYPLNLYNRMPSDKKISNLGQVNSLILEDVWNRNPKWLELLIVDSKVKEQLDTFFKEYKKI